MPSFVDASRLFSANLQKKFNFYDWGHASTILKHDFAAQFADLSTVLEVFELRRSQIVVGGGGKSSVSGYIDSELYKLGWVEKQFKIVLDIDGIEHDTPTHKVDCVKGRVALDVEWNNKTEFYDRDLNNFRLLHNLKAISVGIIITRSSSLQASTFNPLGLGSKYGASTTHFNKLLPKIEGGGAGGCPLLVITIEDGAYIDNMVPILTAPKP